MAARAKRQASTPVVARLRPETLKWLKVGARYHGVPLTQYAKWLIEMALKDEVRYYGWVISSPEKP